jgi:predicted PurR-regulated permease PerM
MTKAMVKGQFIIALAQGIVDASLLWVVGIDYFFFWLVLLTFLSIIPLGGGIIVIPIGIILILTGNIWQGLVLILGHILIVTNIDNILRPKLVPKDAKLDSALLILSVFAGIAMFGFLGIVIGPVIMILIVTTIEAYIKVNKNRDLENTTQISK